MDINFFSFLLYLMRDEGSCAIQKPTLSEALSMMRDCDCFLFTVQIIVKRLFAQDEETKQELASVKAQKEKLEGENGELKEKLESSETQLKEVKNSGEKQVRMEKLGI